MNQAPRVTLSGVVRLKLSVLPAACCQCCVWSRVGARTRKAILFRKVKVCPPGDADRVLVDGTDGGEQVVRRRHMTGSKSLSLSLEEWRREQCDEHRVQTAADICKPVEAGEEATAWRRGR